MNSRLLGNGSRRDVVSAFSRQPVATELGVLEVDDVEWTRVDSGERRKRACAAEEETVKL
jgi:hypothetical protein